MHGRGIAAAGSVHRRERKPLSPPGGAEQLRLREEQRELAAISKVPFAEESLRFVDAATDAVRVAQVMRLYVTFDHRILDGAHAAGMTKRMRRIFADPVAAFGEIPGPS